MKNIFNWLKEKYFNFIEKEYYNNLNRKKTNQYRIKNKNVAKLSKDMIVRMDIVRQQSITSNIILNDEFLNIEKNKRNRLFNKLKKFKMLMDGEYIDITKESGKATLNGELLKSYYGKDEKDKPYIDRDNIDVEKIKDNNKK